MNKHNPHTALLVMDMQAALLSSLPAAPTLIANTAKAINAARAANIPVIYVRVGFRHGMPEIGINNKGFASARERFAGVDMDKFLEIVPELAPKEDELITTKRRVCAFTGSDLEVILRAKDIQHIVLTGFATSGVVLSTVREAADKDYQITVIEDCCGDGDEEVHRVLTTKIFPRQADVVNTEGWIKLIN